MAITLITGLPGHGKTLYTLWRFKAEAEKSGRPVFQCAGEPDASVRVAGQLKPITGLKLPWPTIDPMKWHECPAGSIVIIDEAQFVFPTRGRGEPPDWVARLATHRHLGIDLVLITQGPMGVDSFVRSLVERHFDVVRKFGSHWCTVHEYPNGCRDIVRKSRGTESIRHEWRYPREVFDWYTSAEMHTVKLRVPWRVWLLLVVPLVFAGLVYVAWHRLNPYNKAAEGEGAKAADLARGGRPGVPGGASAGVPAGVSAEAFSASYQPRVQGLDYTAPVYDEVTKPVEAPYPAACVATGTRCQCYSQQGTRLQVPAALCGQIVSGGFFVAWRPDGGRVEARPVPAPAPAAVVPPGAGFGGFDGSRTVSASVPLPAPELPASAPARGRAPAR